MNFLQRTIAPIAIALLSGCGGGGGGTGTATGPITSTLSFPLKSAQSALVASGFNKNFTISGTSSGSASLTRSAAAGGATFEGVSGRLSAVSTVTLTFTNCTPASSAGSITGYWDTNYTPLGSNVVSGDYSVYLTPPTIPTSVTVGNTGIAGTLTSYTNSTKTVSAGHTDLSYVTEPDTASTAIVNLIGKTYNASNVLTSTSQDRYRIAATGALTLVSSDIQYSNGSTTHLILQ